MKDYGIKPSATASSYLPMVDITKIADGGKSDELTSLNLIGALSHEFGHALESQALFDGLEGKLAPELIGAFQLQAKRGQVAPSVLKALQKVAPAELSSFISGALQTPKSETVLKMSREILKEWEDQK